MPVALASRDDDPRRLHLRECARCQALQRMYETFMTPAAHLPEPERRDAVERLQAAIASRPPVATRGRELRRSSPLEWFLARWSWMVPAAAAAVLCVVLVGRELRPGRDTVTLRSGPAGRTAADLHIDKLEIAADGGLNLSWPQIPGADAYEVRFFSADLKEVGRLGPFQGGELQVKPSDSVLASGEAVLVRVVALRQGAPAAMSPVRPVPRR
jgi:hypothetical protein